MGCRGWAGFLGNTVGPPVDVAVMGASLDEHGRD